MNRIPKTVLVTGASTGIGKAIALAAAKNYAKIILLGRDEKALTDVKKAVEQAGAEAAVVVCDLRDTEHIEQAVKQCGPIDILVNAAGVWHNDKTAYYGKKLWEIPASEIVENFQVNTQGPMLLTRGLLPYMVEQNEGKVINISGTFEAGGANWVHHFVTKKAVEHFTAALADELKPYGVQVNCVSPSDVKTPALKRFFPDDYETGLEPDAVAKLVLFLASDDADNITGQCITIKNKEAYR